MLKQKVTKKELLYFGVYVCEIKLQIACQDLNFHKSVVVMRRS